MGTVRQVVDEGERFRRSGDNFEFRHDHQSAGDSQLGLWVLKR